MVRSQSSDFPSKNQIEKAGKYLRDVVSGAVPRSEVDQERLVRSITVVTTFREAHGYPMQKVRGGLASMVSTEQITPIVTQRHKRVPRIVRKLTRMPGTNLARLEDIGGCRVVVEGADEMDRLCKRIRKNWSNQMKRERDYVAEPKAMGYRARHFVVIRDQRAIEVQVRTRGQQRWAETVEVMDSRFKLNLKDEDGPAELVENFQLAGEILHRREFGLSVDSDLLDQLRASNAKVIEAGYFSR